MEKRKPWQMFLIIAVLVLTIYNILPTIIYYMNPLKDSVDEKRAETISSAIVERLEVLEEDTINWIYSFSKNLGIKVNSVNINHDDPQLISVAFEKEKDAKLFSKFLSKAGQLIPFTPAQLQILKGSQGLNQDPNVVLVSRQIAYRLDPAETKNIFKFTHKTEENGKINPFYKDVMIDRIAEVAYAFGGPSKIAAQLGTLVDNSTNHQYDDAAIALANEIIETEKFLGKTNPILKRWYGSFTQIDRSDANELVQKYIARLQTMQGRYENQIKSLTSEINRLKGKEDSTYYEKEDLLTQLNRQNKTIAAAIESLQKNIALFKSVKKPLERNEIGKDLAKEIPEGNIQFLSLKDKNPFVESLVIDWNNNQLTLKFYQDVQKIRLSNDKNEFSAYSKEKLNQIIINDIARVSSISDEKINPNGDSYAINLASITGTNGILTIDLTQLAKKESHELAKKLAKAWNPQLEDFERSEYPIRAYSDFLKENDESQDLGLIVYSPSDYESNPIKGFRSGSIYIIAKGINEIESKYLQNPNSAENKQFHADLKALNEIMNQYGFLGYSGASYGIDPSFKNDYIFELSDYYSNLLKATRENFTVKGSKRFAVLDLTDVEQRLLTRNKIDDRIQEDLLKWKEEYDQAQVSQDPMQKYLIPPPTKNVFWENFKLSTKKYFRGDERKILKWGLDLSGGKTVRIGLKDHNNRKVTDPEELKQAVNELYTRINKMGVSERTIRIENDNIILEFPGSQGLSATDLIKASAMYFHIVNEKFSSMASPLRENVQTFLQNVWNEAVVTNRKDPQSVNEIAWKHLGGDEISGEVHPKTEIAKLLYENGLRLPNPNDTEVRHEFNDSISKIVIQQGEDFSDWGNNTHPLMIVFRNYALEGASLTNIQVGYDPSQGNTLGFQVKGSYDYIDGNPRADFYQWTSHFAEDQIKGTQNEAYTKGAGWRMAVILNDRVISHPSLKAALRDGGSISGHFTQREIDRLAADLKAGSMTYTPQILSEQNISPELGKEERTKGIYASLIALLLVIAAMVGYYRFAGIVACCAVFFNLLIMWGILQNLGAALTLPGIAGIVLTIGMAVDANVLVFERIREEFRVSGRIASAIQAGYRKAFSAIVDSNVTTIIAALILLQFDSGPIKGFAVTLIIGIISSMFTALFVTRFYFAGWVKNPKNKELKMSQFIGDTKFDFLKYTKPAFVIATLVILLGGYLFTLQKNTMFGMDFTGGYSLTVEVKDQSNEESYRVRALNALVKEGLKDTLVDVRELSRPTQLRIQVSVGAEEPGQPFADLPEQPADLVVYEYQSIPKLNWVVNALEKGGLEISQNQLEQLDKNWSVISGQFSSSMRNNAIIALSFALISILIYITFRFEFKYGISAMIALGVDLLITLAILALFHLFGFAVQINLEIIGALMTIIGYSLNDKIIVFDRIREDVEIYRKKKFSEIVNHAINVTLTRTIMTSGTTLLVLIALVLFGGKSIFGFSLVMTIGVIVGTLSSFFIASPLLLFFHNREHGVYDRKEIQPKKV